MKIPKIDLKELEKEFTTERSYRLKVFDL